MSTDAPSLVPLSLTGGKTAERLRALEERVKTLEEENLSLKDLYKSQTRSAFVTAWMFREIFKAQLMDPSWDIPYALEDDMRRSSIGAANFKIERDENGVRQVPENLHFGTFETPDIKRQRDEQRAKWGKEDARKAALEAAQRG